MRAEISLGCGKSLRCLPQLERTQDHLVVQKKKLHRFRIMDIVIMDSRTGNSSNYVVVTVYNRACRRTCALEYVLKDS